MSWPLGYGALTYGALTYGALNAPFLGLALLVALAALLVRRAPLWRVLGLTALAVLALTAVFDNVLVGSGIVGYDVSRISGAFVGVAPIEDFAYAIAAVLLLPSLWRLLTPAPPSAPPPAPPAPLRRVAQNAPSRAPKTGRSGRVDGGRVDGGRVDGGDGEEEGGTA